MGKIRVVELFAGVGGFRVGLEKASQDFVTVWANQWEPGRKNQFAADCYASNFKEKANLVIEDINLTEDDVPEHDLLVGGFPCQDYSVASTRAHGIKGKKGVLWWNIDHIVDVHRPKYILLENVDRLLRSPVNARGRDFGMILRCLAEKNYSVEWRVINAADYGLQQRRRRTFIFAVRNDNTFATTYEGAPDDVILHDGFFAEIFPVKDKNPRSKKYAEIVLDQDKYPTKVDISDFFKADFYHAGYMKDYVAYTRDVESDFHGNPITLRDVLQNDVDEGYYVSEENLKRWKYMKGAKNEPRKHKDGTPYRYKEGAIPFPDLLDRAGRTMLTSEGTVNRSSHLILDPVSGRYRILTPVECERLNGFPDDWTDTGMTERQRYFCMGNALVVQLVTKMGERISDIEEDMNLE